MIAKGFRGLQKILKKFQKIGKLQQFEGINPKILEKLCAERAHRQIKGSMK